MVIFTARQNLANLNEVKINLIVKFANLAGKSYTGWPKKTGTVDFQDFALINSYLFSPCCIENLFLIIITPRSSNLVENFLFYE